MIIQMKGTEQYFPVVMFIMLYKVVITFEFVDEILKCDHSNGPFAASGHMVHAGGQAAHWDIQNKENSNLS